ncbi:ADP-ribosylglycohydrolase family protein [Vibrio cyclitrophicus]
MIGAIVGDISGSAFENNQTQLKSYNLSTEQLFSHLARPTDDSVLISATAQAMLDESDDFASYYKHFALAHPNAGYGPGFSSWLNGDSQEYQSFGNGAAVRASVLGYLQNENDVLDLAKRSALVSHRHEEGIAGAEAMAWIVWAVRRGISGGEISQELYHRWNYYVSGSPSHDLISLRKQSWFDCSAVNTVPLAIFIACFNSSNFEGAIRSAQFVGGDVDTIAAMSGIIRAQTLPIPFQWEQVSRRILWNKAPLILQTLSQFESVFEPDINKSL